MKFVSLSEMLRNLTPSSDNLHRIAISNLNDSERTLRRWWSKKYGQPHKSFEDHTIEELAIEMFEDYYQANPVEIDRFNDSVNSGDENWDGKVSVEHEEQIRSRLAKLQRIDISRFQSDEELTEEDEQRILDNLGRDLPMSRSRQTVVKTKKGEEVKTLGLEFDEDFGE